MTEHHREEEAASQTERNGEHYGQRQDVRLVLRRKNQVDEDETQQEDDCRRIRSLGLLTCQALIIVAIARRQHLGSYLLGGLQCFTGRVAVAHRSRHVNRGKQVEAIDIQRTIDTLQTTELLNRSHATRSAHIDTLERLWRHAGFRSTLNHDTIELTIAIEVRRVQSTIVAL